MSLSITHNCASGSYADPGSPSQNTQASLNSEAFQAGMGKPMLCEPFQDHVLAFTPERNTARNFAVPHFIDPGTVVTPREMSVMTALLMFAPKRHHVSNIQPNYAVSTYSHFVDPDAVEGQALMFAPERHHIGSIQPDCSASHFFHPGNAITPYTMSRSGTSSGTGPQPTAPHFVSPAATRRAQTIPVAISADEASQMEAILGINDHKKVVQEALGTVAHSITEKSLASIKVPTGVWKDVFEQPTLSDMVVSEKAKDLLNNYLSLRASPNSEYSTSNHLHQIIIHKGFRRSPEMWVHIGRNAPHSTLRVTSQTECIDTGFGDETNGSAIWKTKVTL
ncbi:hypothetical protein HD554DRAFT_2039604 [Boletus coccyginus]|nr:hypothetical protein HD554DRAFT_2039604 [Boletus coccyginus]